MDDQDYKTFLYFLKRYLSPPEDPHQGKVTNFVQVRPERSEREIIQNIKPCRQTNLYKEIRLFCYCLMPNHFHLMVQQSTEKAITDFMRRLTNSYTKYFNEKYKRVGSLFQGRYKAVLIKKEIHFLYLPYYIHYNPAELFKDKSNIKEAIENYSWSSIDDYLGKRNTSWIYKKGLMKQFMEAKEQDFNFQDSKKILGSLTLE